MAALHSLMQEKMATAKNSRPRSASGSRTGQTRFSGRWRLLALLGAGLAALGYYYHQSLEQQSRLGAAYAARIGCSCHYLDGRDLGSCRADLEPGMQLLTISADEDSKSVTARVPGLASQTASWRRGWGCVLDKWED